MFYIDLQYPVNFEQTMLTDTCMYLTVASPEILHV